MLARGLRTAKQRDGCRHGLRRGGRGRFRAAEADAVARIGRERGELFECVGPVGAGHADHRELLRVLLLQSCVRGEAVCGGKILAGMLGGAMVAVLS